MRRWSNRFCNISANFAKHSSSEKGARSASNSTRSSAANLPDSSSARRANNSSLVSCSILSSTLALVHMNEENDTHTPGRDHTRREWERKGECVLVPSTELYHQALHKTRTAGLQNRAKLTGEEGIKPARRRETAQTHAQSPQTYFLAAMSSGVRVSD